MNASHAFKARVWSCLLLPVALIIAVLFVTTSSQGKSGFPTDVTNSGADVLVNDPSGDSGPSRTQFDTSLAINGDNRLQIGRQMQNRAHTGAGTDRTGSAPSASTASTVARTVR